MFDQELVRGDPISTTILDGITRYLTTLEALGPISSFKELFELGYDRLETLEPSRQLLEHLLLWLTQLGVKVRSVGARLHSQTEYWPYDKRVVLT